MRHFLSERDLTTEEFRSIIQRGSELRKQWEAHECHLPITGGHPIRTG